MKCKAPCVPECGREASVRGYCDAHYARLLRGARMDVPVRVYERQPVLCTAPCDPPCTRPAKALGLCRGHYNRYSHGRRIDLPVQGVGKATLRPQYPLCKAPCDPPCDWPGERSGYCEAHYRRWSKGGDMSLPVRRKEGNVPRPCRVCGRLCGGTVCASCEVHELRYGSKEASP